MYKYNFKVGDLVRHCYKDCYGIGIIVYLYSFGGPVYYDVYWTKVGLNRHYEINLVSCG